MGVFKLDLMTLLVIFVVISVIFTMTSGKKEESSAPVSSVEKPLVQGMNQTGTSADFSTANFRTVSPKINHSKFSSKTWN